MTTLYLIRHAEADGNVYRRIHGQYDGFVTPRGYMQIKKLYDRFSDVHIDAVYSSDLYRTLETARGISEAHGLDIQPRRTLREINLGVWEDITWGEAMASFPDDYELWSNTPEMFHIENGESYMQIYTRAMSELHRIAAAHPGETVAAVTHGTVIRAIVCMLRFGNMHHLPEIPWCDNTGVAKLCIRPDMSCTLEYFNDNTHLQELSTLGKQRWWKDDTDPALCNLRFIPAQFPRDLDLADSYYRASWSAVFSEDTYDAAYTRSRLAKLSAANPQAVVFAQQGELSPIGIVALDTKTQLLPKGGHITLLYLKEEHCGREMGAQLLGHAVSVYRALGRRLITVRAAQQNTRALRFYEKYGFEQFGIERTQNGTHLLLRKDIVGAPAHINWK